VDRCFTFFINSADISTMFNLKKKQKTWLDGEDDDDVLNIQNISLHISKRK